MIQFNHVLKGLPQWLSGKESAMHETQEAWVEFLGQKGPGGGNGNPLQYSCLGNPIDRGAWQATVQRVSKSRT